MATNIRDVPVYVINLPDRTDRWERFNRSNVGNDFHNIQRVNATNGHSLSFENDRRISLNTRYSILRNYRRSHYEIATLGAVGASFSHINTWKRFYKSGKPMCLIMEDDAGWKSELLDTINKAYDQLPHQWGVWLLGYNHIHFQPFGESQHSWNTVMSFTGAHCYLLRREAAKKLLEEPFPIETHIEFYMTGVSALKNMLIVQHSDIQILPGHSENGEVIDDSDTRHPSRKECPVCSIPDDLLKIYESATPVKKGHVRVGKPRYGAAAKNSTRRRHRRERNLRNI